LERLDSGFRRNDAKREFLTFYEFVNWRKTVLYLVADKI